MNTLLAPNGYGASVRVAASGKSWHTIVAGGSTFISQSELSAHFGLGDAIVVDELQVEWADGQVTLMSDVATGQTLTIAAPPMVGDLNADGQIGFADLIVLLSAWGPCGGDCPADLDGSGSVDFNDLLQLLVGWT